MSLIFILSDIHIGDNSPTCWYQQKYHEPYLLAVLDSILKNADRVQELILLGDLVDFWTYPPDRQPPSFQDIMDANPNVLGRGGKLDEVVHALGGRVSYLNGNHDISLTQDDLNLLNPQIQHRGNIYFPLAPDNRLVCTHGHLFTMFNAPDTLSGLNMPVGHFVTRAVAYMMQNKLQPGETVADISNNGAPGIDIGALLNLNPEDQIATMLLEYIRSQTEIPQDQKIILPNGTTVTYKEAESLYSRLWRQWVDLGGGGEQGMLYAYKSAIADNDGTYMAWFAEQMALTNGATFAVTGHTHFPKLGLNESLIQYINSGFMCHAKPDSNIKHFNFAVIDTERLVGEVDMVTDDLQVQLDTSVPPDSILGPLPIVGVVTSDFSTYLIIENPTSHDWQLQSQSLGNGYWVVPPRTTIRAGETVTYWAQDYPGIHGTDGNFIYECDGVLLSFSFDCPTGLFPNKAASNLGTVYARSANDPNWGVPGYVPSDGHPLFVKLVLPENIQPKASGFATYTLVQNNTPYMWRLASQHLDHGYWRVEPPAAIPAGAVIAFWADNRGLHGSTTGSVEYHSDAPNPKLSISFSDPYSGSNSASTNQGTLYAKSGSDADWGPPGHVPGGNHPLFVKVVLS